LFERQRRNQAGLAASGDRRLGHYGDPAGRDGGIVDISDCGSHDPSHAARPATLSSVGAAGKEKAIHVGWPVCRLGQRAAAAARSRTRERKFVQLVPLLTEFRQWHAGRKVTQPSNLARAKPADFRIAMVEGAALPVDGGWTAH
jgi:hypothetical protein